MVVLRIEASSELAYIGDANLKGNGTAALGLNSNQISPTPAFPALTTFSTFTMPFMKQGLPVRDGRDVDHVGPLAACASER